MCRAMDLPKGVTVMLDIYYLPDLKITQYFVEINTFVLYFLIYFLNTIRI